MKVYNGRGVSEGIAMGRIRVYQRKEPQVTAKRITDPARELLRIEAARAEAVRQLQELYEKARWKAGETEAAIFLGQRIMLEDEECNDYIKHIVLSRQVNAEAAVAEGAEHFARMLGAVEDGYLRERAADVQDISRRVLRALERMPGGEVGSFAEEECRPFAGGECSPSPGGGVSLEEPFLLVAEDLSPSETVQLDRSLVGAFVTVGGSPNSHTAILAGTMGIPALVGTPLPLDEGLEGKYGIVDGFSGKIYVEPDPKTLSRMKELQQEAQRQRQLLENLKGQESVTLDGRRLMVCANVDHSRDLAAALENGAEGIGLFRSEFLYLERQEEPTEEEQLRIYRQAVQAMGGRRVLIRTLDLGADKQCGYLGMEPEENPALGCRGIRFCLARPRMFRTQLRALLRAAAYGRLGILYPMITSLWEVKQLLELTEQVKAELTQQGIEWGRPEQGIMIETPAAALISDLLAEEVDFFCIGTNDLTQYALAADRRNGKLDPFYDDRHPAVLRMIALTVENAHRAGIWAGICGGLGADLTLTREFLAMGVDELSVPAGSILPIRKLVSETDVTEYLASKKREGLRPL